MYGGFAGTEDQLTDRAPAGTNPTVISADVLGDDAGSNKRSDNLGVLFVASAVEDVTIDGLSFVGISSIPNTRISIVGVDFYGGISPSKLAFTNNRIEDADGGSSSSGSDRSFFRVAGIETATIKGNQLIRNRGDWKKPAIMGASSLFFEGNLYQENKVPFTIGAVGATVNVDGNTFRDNDTPHQVLDLQLAKETKTFIRDNLFENNGTAIYSWCITTPDCSNSFTLERNTFEHNKLGVYGVEVGGKYTFEGNTFANGIEAIYLVGTGEATLESNKFKNYGSSYSGYLGARVVGIEADKTTAQGNLFEDNDVEGPIFLLQTYQSSLTENQFFRNTGAHGTLVITAEGRLPGDFVLTENKFANNKMIGKISNTAGGVGTSNPWPGAAYIENANSVNLTRNTFTNNEGSTTGGVSLYSKKIILIENTFTNNRAVKVVAATRPLVGSLYEGRTAAIHVAIARNLKTNETDWPEWETSGNSFTKNSGEVGVIFLGLHENLTGGTAIASFPNDIDSIFDSAPSGALYTPDKDTFSQNSAPKIVAYGYKTQPNP